MNIRSILGAPFYAVDDGGSPGGGAAPAAAAVPEPAGGTLGTPPAEPVVANEPVEPAGKPAPKSGTKPEEKPAAITAVDGPALEVDKNAPKPTDIPWEERVAKMVGDDKKAYDRLIRMKGEEGLWKAYRAMEVERDSGKWAKKLPTHYTAEELADYKKSNGIPDKPDGYDINLGNGIVWGDNDKPHIDNYTAYALKNNMTPDEVKRGLGWWADYQQDLVALMDASDDEHATEAQIEMRAKWGKDEKRNRNFMRNQFEGISKDAWRNLVMARGPDGRLIGNNAETMFSIFDKLKAGDPDAYELPGEGQSAGKTLDEEMKELQGMMRDKSSAYYAKATRDEIQARYRTLIDRDRARKANA